MSNNPITYINLSTVYLVRFGVMFHQEVVAYHVPIPKWKKIYNRLVQRIQDCLAAFMSIPAANAWPLAGSETQTPWFHIMRKKRLLHWIVYRNNWKTGRCSWSRSSCLGIGIYRLVDSWGFWIRMVLVANMLLWFTHNRNAMGSRCCMITSNLSH